MLINGIITPRHGKALFAVPDKDQQYTLAMRVPDEDLNVRDIEREARKISKERRINLLGFPD